MNRGFSILIGLALVLCNPFVHAGESPLPDIIEDDKDREGLIYERVNSSSFMCGCGIDETDGNIKQEADSFCFLTPPEHLGSDSYQLRTDRVFPVKRFGQMRRCWNETKTICPAKNGEAQMSQTACCLATDKVFKTAYYDLHNLVPNIKGIFGDENIGEYNWGIVRGHRVGIRDCVVKFDTENKIAEPPEKVQGNLARIMLYMSHTYGFKLSEKEVKMYKAWMRYDPVRPIEVIRNNMIERYQGNINPFIGIEMGGDRLTYDAGKINQYPDISGTE
ncbi:endonuclease [Candidatus Albibeggiatoa sp. nov. NOAA]|uniref:endonuclease n=1 Tax=Candidatus Albibeggiatoa sp. nov. NOAA TaxID=3162724 RepID=UPI0032FC5E98|nr:endonuclease [Thiotrichaceae bacterium]